MKAELPYIEAKGTHREVGRQIGEAARELVLRDHGGAPLSICSHWDDNDSDLDQSVTTVSMVWEPAERCVHVAVGQPCEHEYVTYSL